MEIKKYKETILKIRNSKDDIERVTLLQELYDDYTKVTSENISIKTQLESVTQERDEYARLNNKYFLQLDTQEDRLIEKGKSEEGEEGEEGEEDENSEETLELDFLGGNK